MLAFYCLWERLSLALGCTPWLEAPCSEVYPSADLCVLLQAATRPCRLARPAGGFISRQQLPRYVHLGRCLFLGSKSPGVQVAHMTLGLPAGKSEAQ